MAFRRTMPGVMMGAIVASVLGLLKNHSPASLRPLAILASALFGLLFLLGVVCHQFRSIRVVGIGALGAYCIRSRCVAHGYQSWISESCSRADVRLLYRGTSP
jgi:hypothetical protein